MKLLEKEKTTIRKNTRQLAIIKLIQALTGGWWQGLQLDKMKITIMREVGHLSN